MTIRLAKKAVRQTGCNEPQVSYPTELLSIRQAASYAGVAEITVRRWIKSRALAAYRVGGQIRIDRSSLVDFMQEY